MIRNTSYIELSKDAVERNVKFIKKLIGPEVIFSSVVKGNAYGHGIEMYCPLAYEYGVRHFSVSDANEAYRVKNALPVKDCPIMIMGMIENQQLEWAVENDIEFYVFEESRLEAALEAAIKVGKKASIHLEVETGMNRTGIDKKDFKKVVKFINEHHKFIEVKGMCTHLAGAESIANYKRIKDQRQSFKEYIKKADKLDFNYGSLHMASSSATIRYPKTRYDLVRVGILQYGFFPTEEIWVHYFEKNKPKEYPMDRIVSWKSQVMDVKEIPPGEFIGYGTSFFTNTTTKRAIIPIGYSSGYSRALSNRGKVLINGKRLDVIGTVNMNMMAVELSTAPEVKKGDEVVLIGKQGDQEIGVSSFSDFSQLINYELLTRLPQNIDRIVV